MGRRKVLLVIVGPTAIGKTALAIRLAQHFSTEIISADSRQFYQLMTIGTAKPDAQELAAAKHHFVDFLPVSRLYSAGEFERDALERIAHLHETHDVVIMAGGSGLYVNAVCYGFDDLPADLGIRQMLTERAENEGLTALFNELQQLDPLSAERIDANNTQRIVRALEVCKVSGKPFSSFHQFETKNRDFEIIMVGLQADREVMFDRIHRRVDQMIEAGLLEEVRSLLPYRKENALKSVGYREFFDYFDGCKTMEDAVDRVKRNTRHFAKRQMTWFKRYPVVWFDYQDTDSVVNYLDSHPLLTS
ncbi:MAG: tRNA (adenosine(37)-N6)-dimethylallyltransferase MiaA [Flavobacteriales bacterium]|nr:tRNA (adenosine(37)-N6)-dimethylallyltransferase MiaA [Flavobacteriales bacterium]